MNKDGNPYYSFGRESSISYQNYRKSEINYHNSRNYAKTLEQNYKTDIIKSVIKSEMDLQKERNETGTLAKSKQNKINCKRTQYGNFK